MVLNIFSLLFVLGITFMNSLFGLFSGMLNVFCAVVAMCVAFGCVEPLNGLLTKEFELHPAYTEPLALVLLFVVTLLVLRAAADNLIRGNVKVPMYVDWVGGGLAGVIYAQICVGMMVISFLMLPWGGRVMMYERAVNLDRGDKDDYGRMLFEEGRLWTRSDEMTAWLFKTLSSGSLSGATAFGSVYPDYARWVGYTGNQVQDESLPSPIRDKNGDGFESGLKVEKTWTETKLASDAAMYRKSPPAEVEKGFELEKKAPFELSPKNGQLLVVRVQLNVSSADRDKNESTHRFRASMFRVVGVKGELAQEYYPVGIGGADGEIGTLVRVADYKTNFSLDGRYDKPIDLFFDVPNDFEPRFVEYRRHARAAVAPKSADEAKKEQKEPRLAGPAVKREGQTAADVEAGPVGTFLQAIKNKGDKADLPLKLDAGKILLSEYDSDCKGTEFLHGRFKGPIKELTASEEPKAVTQFQLPEGMRLFQMETNVKKMVSLPGQAMNFVQRTTAQPQIEDDKGNTYRLAGYYGIVKRGNNEKFIELFYEPSTDKGYNAMLDFKDSKILQELSEQDDAVLGLLWLVPKGACITKVKLQGGGEQIFEKVCVKN